MLHTALWWSLCVTTLNNAVVTTGGQCKHVIINTQESAVPSVHADTIV